ncbi:MAG: ATP-dependent helicase HrpB [Pseudomonadales bacterium]
MMKTPLLVGVDLPINDVLAELETALASRDEAVLEAPPGAGKTTVIPLALLDSPWLAGRKILMLEPRRLAARAAAERMAQTLGEKVGETVGYRVRLDSKVSAATRIEVITEGILTRMLQDDPALEQIGLLIFDEFHERSLDADLGLALTLQGRELFSDTRESPLKLLLMSATLNGTEVSKLLDNAPIVSSHGQMFPVKLHYAAPFQFREDVIARVCETVLLALAEEQGSVLVFLPGQGEIRRVYQRLQQSLSHREEIELAPLYGDLSLAEQRRAIEAPAAGQRKVVLATSLAETSLTINGVRVVIDAGLSRLPSFDPATGMTRLQTCRVSKASSIQRMGRAGRTEPGSCYRLWSASQQDSLAAFTPPEILAADLAPLALQLLRWGVSEPQELKWLDAPPQAPWQQAIDLLVNLGAAAPDASANYQLTPHGLAMATLPVHPRLAHLLLVGSRLGLKALACDIAALLGERDLLASSGRPAPVDIHLRLDVLDGSQKAGRQQQGVVQRVRQQSKQLRKSLAQHAAQDPVVDPEHERWAGFLLACAYPDRIAARRRTGGASYQLSNGRSADLPDGDGLQSHEWLSIGQIGGLNDKASDKIYLAAKLDKNLFDNVLADAVDIHDLVEWDNKTDRIVMQRQVKVGALVLWRKELQQTSDSARQKVLLEVVRRKGLGILNWSSEAVQLRDRVLTLSRLDAETWPDFSDRGLLESLEQWLLPYLQPVSLLSHFKQLDLHSILQSTLNWPLPKLLDQQAPRRLSLANGKSAAIDYSQNPPVLAAKLQSMFGCTDTPTIAAGRMPLLIHLLSPAGRPLQVTQDLAGFWISSYHEVKKDMKGRYPKHAWPDDPMSYTGPEYTRRKK